MSTEISSSSSPIISTSKDDDDINNELNEQTIKKLYKALSEGDMDTMASLIAADKDLEYWFHGPPNCQHMMRLLTGGAGPAGMVTFRFEPRSVTAVGGACVIAEGWEGAKAYWVHVWTVAAAGGVVTGLREYFNTWLTVRDLRPGWDHRRGRHVATLLWRSMPRDLFPRSLPGLLLAI